MTTETEPTERQDSPSALKEMLGIDWKNVTRDGYPPCDSDIVFIGVNSAGYCGCFNEHGLMSDRDGKRSVCLYATAESCDEVMTDLEWWAQLEMPALTRLDLRR